MSDVVFYVYSTTPNVLQLMGFRDSLILLISIEFDGSRDESRDECPKCSIATPMRLIWQQNIAVVTFSRCQPLVLYSRGRCQPRSNAW